MSEKTYSLRVERTFDAPREAVFRAWTTADLLKQWLHPADDWSTTIAEMDLRVGGTYRWGIASPDGGTFYEVGEFLEIKPPSRLVYTCRYEDDEIEFDMPHEQMVVTVEIAEVGGKAHVVVTQDGYLRERDRDEQQSGWPSFLEQLERLLSNP